MAATSQGPHMAPPIGPVGNGPTGLGRALGAYEGPPTPLTPPPRFPWLWQACRGYCPQPREVRAPPGLEAWLGHPSRLARPRWAQGRRETAEQPLPSPTHPTRQTPGSNLPPPLWSRVPRLVLGTSSRLLSSRGWGLRHSEAGPCPHLLGLSLAAPPGLSSELATPSGQPPRAHLASRDPRTTGLRQRLPDRQTHGPSVSQAP